MLPALPPPFRRFQHRRLEGGRSGRPMPTFHHLNLVSTWRLRLAAPAAPAAVPRLPASALGRRTMEKTHAYLPPPQSRLYVVSTPRRFHIRPPLLPLLAPPFYAFQHRRLEGGQLGRPMPTFQHLNLVST
ncbi:hypothetical protein DFH09DRAFT_1326771 [Mycena vulgaris]|nr:hypothetical protein DFH09DRAFT_1326771 [Mycena vulgaris]